MTPNQIANSISYCGLICILCSQDGSCDCRSENHCGKRLSPEGCFQHDCCSERGYAGCWECPDFSCDKDMFNSTHVRLRAFVKCIQQDGIEAFSQYIARNRENGVVYHRNGYTGDYDLDTEEAILHLLRTGETPLQHV